MYQQPNQTNNNIMIILVQTGSFEVSKKKFSSSKNKNRGIILYAKKLSGYTKHTKLV